MKPRKISREVDFHIGSIIKSSKSFERREKEREYLGKNRKQDTTVTDGNHHQSEFEDIAAGKDDRNRERGYHQDEEVNAKRELD